ncbi:ABC transporter permease [Paenibacillus xylanexedens]|uniref:ABC transporter permease n=1 Tax=Paenibacillus sp. FSL R7-0272 TaxID=2921679 RepID=UPI0012B75E19|nr:ABC transporter permease [Paenibacillus xylanexedens]
MKSNNIRLTWDMVKREFKNKYAGSTLGLLWSLLLPLGYIIIYTTVFSQLMSAKLPNMTSTLDYSVYLSSGILAWTVFSSTLVRFQNIFIENSNIVKKIYFPKYILINSLTISSIIELVMNYFLLSIVLSLFGFSLQINYMLVLFIIILQQLFCTGLGMILSMFNVHFRDLNQFTSILVQIWFWLTPIAYISSVLPTGAQQFIQFNPMMYFIQGYQNLILYGEINNIIVLIIISTVTYLLGWLVYKKMIDDVTDLI